ncbi:MAG: NAD-dependent epimerase/dehydratase family protein [Solirubrobacteraceae bacterium]
MLGYVRILVTGSAGHLGDGLRRRFSDLGHDTVGLDVLDAPDTVVGSVIDRASVRRCMQGVDAVVHAATLHKPHIDSHSRQDFVATNLTGTLTLLEEAVAAGVERFVFTSTTSAFGRALVPPPGAPAAWITEEVADVPRNVYGVTKSAAEDLCELVHRDHGLPLVILRTSRFFPESDDRDDVRAAYADDNAKVNELLYRRVDIEDAVSAHQLALERALEIGFGRYIISATTPFSREDLAELRVDAPAVVRRLFPDYEALYAERGWAMFPVVERVYVNDRARRDLGWEPRHDFRSALDRLASGEDWRSGLARSVGSKGYHRSSATNEPTGDVIAFTRRPA